MLRPLDVLLVSFTGKADKTFSHVFGFKQQCFLVQVYLIEGFQTHSLSRHIGKREADAEALHGTVSTTLYNTRISKPIKKVPLPLSL